MVGAGVESMTFGYGAGATPDGWSEVVLENKEAEDCQMPMGLTSENVASDYSISRTVQDQFAAASFQKAAAAQAAGKFRDEIVPVRVSWTDPKTEKTEVKVIDADDGVRAGVTAESLAKLKPAFSATGSTHAGNASQVSDGAAAVVLTRRSVARRLGLTVIGKFVTSAVVGVPPRIMGVGPAYAIPKALEKAGLSKDDVDFYEINEAFASQAVFSVQHLGIPLEKVNLNGGAIAMGHPLGCSEYTSLHLRLTVVLTNGFISWSPSSSDWVQHCKADRWQDLRHQHVHWLRNGYGCRLRERAVRCCATCCMLSCTFPICNLSGIE
jgi:acetyl-CoA acyltransferase 1